METIILNQLPKTVPLFDYVRTELTQANQESGAAILDQRGEIENHIKCVHVGALHSGRNDSWRGFHGAVIRHPTPHQHSGSQSRRLFCQKGKRNISASAALTANRADIANEMDTEGRAQIGGTDVLKDDSEDQVATFEYKFHTKLRN